MHMNVVTNNQKQSRQVSYIHLILLKRMLNAYLPKFHLYFEIQIILFFTVQVFFNTSGWILVQTPSDKKQKSTFKFLWMIFNTLGWTLLLISIHTKTKSPSSIMTPWGKHYCKFHLTKNINSSSNIYRWMSNP